MKTSAPFLAALALLALGGCKKAAPAALAPIALTQAGGYWEWEGSYGARIQTPASTGVQRKLRFTNDSIVYVYHQQQLVNQTPYKLRHGRLPRCKADKVYALIHYVTNPATEQQLWNNDLREYTIEQTGSDARLTIRGEHECIDGGVTERYHWRPE